MKKVSGFVAELQKVVVQVAGNCEKYGSTKILQDAMQTLLESIGESGLFAVSVIDMVHSKHSNPGFRWKGPSLLGVEGSFYAEGRRDERVRFCLRFTGTRQGNAAERYEVLFQKIRNVAKEGTIESEEGDSEASGKHENAKAEALSTSVPRALEIETQSGAPKEVIASKKLLPDDSEITAILEILKHDEVNGVLLTTKVLSALEMFNDYWTLVKANGILNILLTRDMIRAEGNDYRIVTLDMKQKEAEERQRLEAEQKNKKVLPDEVAEHVANLLAMSKRYDALAQKSGEIKRYIAGTEQRIKVKTGEIDRRQERELHDFKQKQVEEKMTLLQVISDEKTASERELDLILKELQLGGSLSNAREALMGIFKITKK